MSDGRVDQKPDDKPPILDRNRSLVFVERRHKLRSLERAPSDFVAQLIACAQHLGEYRRARRQEPSVGLNHYRGAPPRAASDFEIKV